MPKRRRAKWILGFLGGGILLLAGALLTLHYWLPWVLGPVAGRFGIHYSQFERVEDWRFVLHNLVATNRIFQFEAKRVEAFLPYKWYREAKQAGTNEPPVFVSVDGWSAEIQERAGKPSGKKESPQQKKSVYDIYKATKRWAGKSREWLPKAVLLNGTVKIKGKEYGISTVTWEKGRLEGNGVWPITMAPIDIKGRIDEEPWQLSYAMNTLDLRVRLRVMETNGLVQTEVRGNYKEAQVDGRADFSKEGTWPIKGSISSKEFRLPADLLKLEGYRELSGNLEGNWVTNAYTLNLRAQAEPMSGRTNLPPVNIELAVRGDTNRVRIERALSTAPGLELFMSSPLELSYKGRVISGNSEIKIAAELGKIPWLKLKGTVEGIIHVEEGGKFPVLRILASGTNLARGNLQDGQAKVEGLVDWPQVKELSVEGRVGTNVMVSFRGSGNVQEKTVQEAIVRAAGNIGTNLLPWGIECNSMQMELTVEGAITNLAHSGNAEVRGFRQGQLAPMNLEMNWSGKQLALEQTAMRLRAGPAILRLSGTGGSHGGKTNFVVRELTLSKGDDKYLELEKPFEVALVGTNLPSRGMAPAIELGPMLWKGENRSFMASGRLVWPWIGEISLNGTNVNPELFQYFVVRSLSGLDVGNLNVKAGWEEGPLYGRLSGNFSFDHQLFHRVKASTELELDAGGLNISSLRVGDDGGDIFQAHGFLPLAVHPLDPVKPIHLSQREAIDFRLEMEPRESFWDTVGELTKVRLENPKVSLEASGTVKKPTGTLKIQARSAVLQQTNRELPKVGPLAVEIRLNEQVLRVPDARVEIEGQPVRFRSETRLGDKFWELGRAHIEQYLMTNSSVRVKTEKVKIEVFQKFFPQFIAPEGTVLVDVGVDPGLALVGSVQMEKVSTRPLPNVGVVQGITAALELQGRKMKVRDVSGILGGERLKISGEIDLSDEKLQTGYPGVNLAIRGENLPLLRNPDIILRSDLDLTVLNTPTNTPIITGVVNLRDSFLLRDIETLVPGRVANPTKRPPYFSINQDPMDDWLLDIRVRGENFMRVRSPFFHGQVSANFHVTGTAEVPVALGESAITSGRVIFPFATLQVRQGLVSLSSDDPYLPKVFVMAQGRAFGFDITMQAEGPANEPVIEFSSVPALSSEEIVLLLTTGQMPRNDFAYSTEQRAGRLAFFLGKSLWSKLNPGGKEEERLIIRSGEDISEQGRQTYAVEYKLSNRWSLVGEYDRFGALNADVKWKIYSR